jgi:hypothetical protein
MAEVKVEGARGFREAALALRAADATVQKEVAKSFRATARPVVSAIRTEVKSSKGATERGVHASTVERQLHILSKVKAKGAGSVYDPATGLRSERRVRTVQRKLARAQSLRDSIAGAAGSAVSASTKTTALRFRVSAGQLPVSQRKLPRRWDAKDGWKHPVFGNRKIWVKQTGHPYFRSTIFQRRPEIDAGVAAAFEAAAEKILHPEEGAE